jgi:hypothetical protein
MASTTIIEAPVSARDLATRNDHPFRELAEVFCSMRNTELTVRQCRKFLQRHPEFRTVRIVIQAGERMAFMAKYGEARL